MGRNTATEHAGVPDGFEKCEHVHSNGHSRLRNSQQRLHCNNLECNNLERVHFSERTALGNGQMDCSNSIFNCRYIWNYVYVHNIADGLYPCLGGNYLEEIAI